jgi:hypothetical protein
MIGMSACCTVHTATAVYRYAEIPQYMKNSEAQAARTGEPLEVFFVE